MLRFCRCFSPRCKNHDGSRQVQGAKPNRKSREGSSFSWLWTEAQPPHRKDPVGEVWCGWFKKSLIPSIDSKKTEVDYRWRPLTRKSNTRSISMCCITLTLPNFPLSSSIPGWSPWFSYKVQYLLGSLGNCRMQYQQIYIWCIWIKWTLLVSSLFPFTRNSDVKLDCFGRALYFELCTLPSP